MTRIENLRLDGINDAGQMVAHMNETDVRDMVIHTRSLADASGAVDRMTTADSRTKTYRTAFVNAFSIQATKRYNELPDVKEENLFYGLETRFKRDVVDAKEILDMFNKRMVDEPSYAFEWGEYAAKAAAVAGVADSCLRILGDCTKTHAETVATLRLVAQREMMSGARNPQRSTSVFSNFIKTETTAAWASVIERFDWV